MKTSLRVSFRDMLWYRYTSNNDRLSPAETYTTLYREAVSNTNALRNRLFLCGCGNLQPWQTQKIETCILHKRIIHNA